MGELIATLDLSALLLMVLGVSGGLIVGAIPGLNATMAMALLTPMTFYLNSSTAIMLLCSVYVGAVSGGLFSAILLRIPGTSSSIASTFDGFPMARQGKAGRAIAIALVASFIGGTTSFILLGFLAPILSKFALKFGPAEYFAVALLGLSTIASVLGASTLRGLVSACFGLLIGTIGADVLVGTPRFTFGTVELSGGFDVLVILIGLFAIPQILRDLCTITTSAPVPILRKLDFPPLKQLAAFWKNFLRSSLIGTWIGLLPGAGGSIASLLSYDQAKKFSKAPETFGTGAEDGIVASETANNAVIGGSLIPLLTLGIPGDSPAAVLLAAFIIHGIQAGPMLYISQPEVVHIVLAGFYLSNVMMIAVAFVGAPFIIRALSIPKNLLLPVIILMCFVGAYAVNQRMFDIWLLVAIGLAGYAMERYRFPVAPAVLGVILGPILESNLRRAIQISDGFVLDIITRPITLGVLLLVLINFLWPVINGLRQRASGQFASAAVFDGNDGMLHHTTDGAAFWNTNRIVGLACIALGIAVYAASLTLPTLALESAVYGPGFYPKILAVTIGFLGLSLALAPERAGHDDGENEPAHSASLLFWVALIVLYALLVGFAGFIIASILFLLAAFFLPPRNTREQKIIKILTGILLPISIYLIFNNIFNILLP